jgi:hypothetical protein
MTPYIDSLITALVLGVASGLGQWIGSSIFPLLAALIQSHLSVW